MAAYAALVSLMHIIEQIEHHPRPPISLDKTQVENLTEKVNFLQEFLEGYSHVGYTKEPDALESRIRDAAHAAEDVIESHIVDQILAASTSHGGKMSSDDLYQGLHKVIQDMDFIKKEAVEIKQKIGVQDQLQRTSISADSSRSSSTGQRSVCVGFDDVLYEVMDKLVGEHPDRQIIPIVGMGGIGKTTLTKNIYQNQNVVQHFDIRAWVTISQEYRMKEILLELLQEGRESLSQMNEYELGDKLHKKLSGRRYLIVMDDVWDIEVWDLLKLFFPDNNNGSRIMLTTRLFTLVSQLDGSHCVELDFLDEEDSWNLLCKRVFDEKDCPLELEEIGKRIAGDCKGLPLSIVVIGGLLAKSEQTQRYWQYIAENLNSIVSLEDNELCLHILYMSYQNLPVYLKPSFLYLGVFPEDSEIRASKLIKLWIAEGFLKPIDGKSMEEVANEHLEELADRNLILVEEYYYNGEPKFLKIHDLVRDLCLNEARKQNFLCVLGPQSLNIPQELNMERRISINQDKEYPPQVPHALKSASLTRSLLWQLGETSYIPPFSFRLLRIASVVKMHTNGDKYYLEAILEQVNLRFLCLDVNFDLLYRFPFPSSISLLWNLQTLIISSTSIISAPSEIWKMPQLKHVMFTELELPDPPSNHGEGQDDIVLENLQTLSCIYNFKCSDEVVKRIPSIKKLKVSYEERSLANYYLNNLGHLHKLEVLCFGIHCLSDPENMRRHLVQNLNFPHSLKKLTLRVTHLHWEDLTTKVGSLPLLEVLKLRFDAFIGPKWETIEGQFSNLKFLLIEDCDDLEYWRTDSTHFPLLEHLFLGDLMQLREIPLSIGDIPTLQLIELQRCGDSAVDSAKRIQEEQEELGNEDLEVLFC